MSDSRLPGQVWPAKHRDERAQNRGGDRRVDQAPGKSVPDWKGCDRRRERPAKQSVARRSCAL